MWSAWPESHAHGHPMIGGPGHLWRRSYFLDLPDTRANCLREGRAWAGRWWSAWRDAALCLSAFFFFSWL